MNHVQDAGLGRLCRPSLLRAWIKATLCLTVFMVWPGADDPWWRPKEIVFLLMGLLWWSVRSMIRWTPLRNGQLRLLSLLLLSIVCQFFFLNLLPLAGVTGGRIVIPILPFLVFFHLVVASIWFTDCVSYLRTGDLQQLAGFLAWVGLALAIYMIFQSVGIDPVVHLIRLRFQKVTWLHDNHMIGLMGGPFQASAALAPFLPAMLALHPILFLIGAISLILTKSASGIGAAMIGSLFIVKARWPRILLPCILLAVSILLFQGRSLMTDYLTRFASIWNQGLEAAFHHPLIGHGLGTFKTMGLQDTGSDLRWAHNEWLQIWIEAGAIPVILLAGWIGSRFIQLGNASYIWAATLATLIFLSLFNTPFHQAPNLFVGLISLAALTIYRKDLRYGT